MVCYLAQLVLSFGLLFGLVLMVPTGSADIGDRKREEVALLRTTSANQSFVEGTWVPCSVGRAGVGVKQREGDNITPVGSWRFEGTVYNHSAMFSSEISHRS